MIKKEERKHILKRRLAANLFFSVDEEINRKKQKFIFPAYKRY